VLAQPAEPAYRITEIRMLAALGRTESARDQYHQLERMNVGGSLDDSLRSLRAVVGD
jgi:hypothetical protein